MLYMTLTVIGIAAMAAASLDFGNRKYLTGSILVVGGLVCLVAGLAVEVSL